MINDLVPIGDNKNDAFSRILAFYEPESDVVLSAAEDLIISRWLHCDKLIRSRKHRTDDIIDQMREKFGISRFTAEKDIAQTNSLFGQIRLKSRSYVVNHAIESLEIQIAKFELDKSLVHLVPKMYQELARMAALLPEEISKKKVEAPNVYIGSLTINNSNDAAGRPVIDIEEAKQKWKARKEKKNKDGYIDHEDV